MDVSAFRKRVEGIEPAKRWGGRVLRKVNEWRSSSNDLNPSMNQKEVVEHEEDCHVICSDLGRGDLHMPVLDIDFEAKLVPSSTEGHYHLYLDKVVTWESYLKLLRALEECGIIQAGYLRMSAKEGYTSVRHPKVKKEAIPEQEFPESAQDVIKSATKRRFFKDRGY